MNKFIYIILLLNVKSAFAALPPTAESLRHIQAIAESHDVYNKLGAVNWVKSIRQNENGYSVESDKCSLQVKVIASKRKNVPPHFVGPSVLTVEVGEMRCH